MLPELPGRALQVRSDSCTPRRHMMFYRMVYPLSLESLVSCHICSHAPCFSLLRQRMLLRALRPLAHGWGNKVALRLSPASWIWIGLVEQIFEGYVYIYIYIDFFTKKEGNKKKPVPACLVVVLSRLRWQRSRRVRSRLRARTPSGVTSVGRCER